MAGGVTLQIRQIGSYPDLGVSDGGELVLVQPGGLGNPYASIGAGTLVGTALENSTTPLMVGIGAGLNSANDQVYTGHLALPNFGGILLNCYLDTSDVISGLAGGTALTMVGDQAGWTWQSGASAGANQPTTLSNQMILSVAGALSLPNGTLTVARDPGGALEVATAGWVGNNTVASFNGRRGVVTLSSADIYAALCLDSCIATENWVNAQIQASIQSLLANHPFVFGWNGRTGAVYLTLADITCVFFQPGQQPVTQTPPLTSNDYSIPNTQWVVEYIANEFAGGGSTLATQAWVLANTVNSFNGRQGVVTLTTADVIDVGAAPLNSPAFSGIPTAPTAAVGQATGQLATTAFVQQAITNNTAGVSTFNTRTGDVVLETADVTAVGGLTNPSAALTGNPTAPTQPPGTNLPVVATCEFVQAALASGAVTSFNTRTGAVTLTLADITGVGGAPLVSPAFSSVPTAPTAAPGTNTVQLATCAFVTAALNAAGGVSSFNGRTGAVDLIPNDISAAGGLVNPSVNLTGSPTATTATAGDNSTRIATTAFVQTALSSGAVSSFNTRTGAVTLQGADITAAGGALLASPAFTGAPTAPTAAPATNNTQIATTAYVTAAILADTTGVTSFNTRTGAISLLLADITGAGGAPISSPSFTGTPLGPTATPGTSTTQLATTQFVQAAIASSGVSSFNARTGAVTLIANDISAAGGALLAGPTFTGVPAAPTAAPGTNTTQLATTAFVAAALSGGPFLPLSGGTLTGPLTLSGSNNLGVGGLLSVSGTGASSIAGTLTVNGTAVSVPNGNIAIGGTGNSTFAGGVQISGANGLNVTGGNAVAIGHNFVSQIAGDGSAFCCFNTSAGAASGIYGSGNGGRLQVASMSGTGAPINNWAYFQSNGLLPNTDNTFTVGYTGQALFSVDSYAFNNASDPRAKKDIGDADNYLGVVNAIAVKHYHWLREDSASPLHIGWLGDDVRAATPGLATVIVGNDEARTLALNSMEMTAILWKAVQELSAEVAALKGAAA